MEANLRSKCFYWAVNPPFLSTSTAVACGLPPQLALSLKFRCFLAAKA